VIATNRILAKASIDPGFASLLDSEELEGMIPDHGQISNEGLLKDRYGEPERGE
jgi:hypothetical protein